MRGGKRMHGIICNLMLQINELLICFIYVYFRLLQAPGRFNIVGFPRLKVDNVQCTHVRFVFVIISNSDARNLVIVVKEKQTRIKSYMPAEGR